MKKKSNARLAIVSTHPIQYYAPVFMLLSKKISCKVFYTRQKLYDKGFQKQIDWDIPLLDGYDYVSANKKVVHKINSFRPDYILLYGWANLHHLRIIKNFTGKTPILFRGDSNLLDKTFWLKKFLKELTLRYIYKHIDIAFYVGTNNKAYFRKYGLGENQLVFAPHAIDNSRFSPGVRSKIKDDLELNETDILVLFAGKFIPAKNPMLLLNAFLCLQLPHVHLLFVGDGKLKNKLVAVSRNCKRVHFMPFQNQTAMPAIYQACDLFCLPSNRDSWGLSVNEAMAAGKAVLVSDKVGAAADLVRNENGKVFKHKNMDDLKKSLQDMTTSRISLKEKGNASLKIIAEWNFETQSNNILNTIRE